MRARRLRVRHQLSVLRAKCIWVWNADASGSRVSPSTVMLQALKEEPPLNAKCKDKFLIQSTVITPDKETMSLQEIVRRPVGMSVYPF